jgi:hypothetical protein
VAVSKFDLEGPIHSPKRKVSRPRFRPPPHRFDKAFPNMIQRPFALLPALFLAFQGCENSIESREGHPPRDQSVRISESKLGSTMKDDTIRTSLFLTYRVDWEIDSESFANGAFRLALVHDSSSYSMFDTLHPVWLPKSRSLPLATRKGTLFDTSTSLGARTYWPNFKVFVMEAIGGGDYLAVASDSIALKDVKP